MQSSRVVLLVDDDPDIRDSVGECLRDEGYEVHTAGNGQEALDRLSDGLRPSVILLDLMMPVLNGFEVLQALRDRHDWRGIPVVIVSANRGYEAEDMRGVFDILRKPVPLERMLETIERALATAALPA
jgi:two-component system nitrogen regulation response regulator NtrX